MALKVYNSLTREVEEFAPINGNKVGFYSCGPTVYNYPHIGNYRAYIFADILKRTLKYLNYDVNHIMNLTDIDDKTIRESQKAGKSLKEFTEFFTEEFYKDIDILNIERANKYTKATDYINEMVEIIEKLIANDHAYKTEDGSVYFNIEKDNEYGKLNNLNKDELKSNAGGRMKTDEYEKESVQDFALWKAWDENDGEVFWETSFGKGRPGWHIECSAMSMSNLGETFDLHTGGIDNKFPHHENEIAQSECATGLQYVKYWMHNAHLQVDGKKMAKSANNFYTLRDLENKNYNPLVFRYLNFSTNYATPLNFTWESMDSAQIALKKLYDFVLDFSTHEGIIEENYKNKFTDAICDDLNMPKALAVVWELVKDDNISKGEKYATLLSFDKVLGLKLSEIKQVETPIEIEELLLKRQEAKDVKDFSTADEIRKQIESLGYEILDTKDGIKVKKL